MGLDNPVDMITSMILDHEQTVGLVDPRTPTSQGSPFSISTGSYRPTAPASLTAAGGAVQAFVLPPQMQTPITGARVRSDSFNLQRSHWKSAEKAVKCASSSCRRRFTWKDRRRNCCMCGEVFCRPCSKFQRKLSSNAEPDPLGTRHCVCKACFDQCPAFCAETSLFRCFEHYRTAHKKKLERKEMVEKQIPLPQRETSRCKRVTVREEADRLTEGFHCRNGLVQNLFDIRIPDWQKSSHWRPSAQASYCSHCKKQFKFTNRKIHCRICGQVFCTDCTKGEIILYTEGEMAKWAINGKSGGPKSPPERFELLPICPDCSTELEAILVEDLTTEPEAKVISFLDQLVPVQKELMELQEKIEMWLPRYQKIVDAMDIEDKSPQAVGGRHPIRELSKAQSDLSDVFSQFAIKSQELKGLQRQARTDTQQKLLQHIMVGTYQFYSENMYLFRGYRDHLADYIPPGSLDEIQSHVNLQSMERVHVLLQQIMYEALNLQKHFGFGDDFLQYYVAPIESIEEEFKVFLEKKGESWEEHEHCVSEFVKSEMHSNRRIKIDASLPCGQTRSVTYVKSRVASECLRMVHSCSRELSAKTNEKEFLKTKDSLLEASCKLDSIVQALQDELNTIKHARRQ